MRMELTAVYMQAPEGGYVALAKEIWGATTQGETLEEARAMLEDAVRLVIETSRRENERFAVGKPVICEPLIVDAPE